MNTYKNKKWITVAEFKTYPDGFDGKLLLRDFDAEEGDIIDDIPTFLYDVPPETSNIEDYEDADSRAGEGSMEFCIEGLMQGTICYPDTKKIYYDRIPQDPEGVYN
jgi:hypothetical protein